MTITSTWLLLTPLVGYHILLLRCFHHDFTDRETSELGASIVQSFLVNHFPLPPDSRVMSDLFAVFPPPLIISSLLLSLRTIDNVDVLIPNFMIILQTLLIHTAPFGDCFSLSETLQSIVPLLPFSDVDKNMEIRLARTVFILSWLNLPSHFDLPLLSLNQSHNAHAEILFFFEKNPQILIFDDNRRVDPNLLSLKKHTASMAVSNCTFSVSSALLTSLITCQAGSLVISGSSSFSSAAGIFTFPLVFTASSSLSAKSGIAVELINTSFNRLKMGEGVGVVELNDADHIKLADVDFADVKLSNDSDAVRIVVRGRDLWRTIARSPNSGFPRRGTAAIDALFQSLDRNEEDRPFHTPTLLVYLSEFTAPTTHVLSYRKDLLHCGDPLRSCNRLDEDGEDECLFVTASLAKDGGSTHISAFDETVASD
ncbi:hypothetical protein BLNAU_10983 [Blattamonas nauphoetae]|uniref:Uncharacterized protein n=1 Tax=Blattamonas nauphoetae TaxID=2049346 RepID=A0ABQ9XR16_9EUKA|nr:hypothetical protein BLNAU_10983 [Blattamonas nauphoetae]